MGKGGGSNEIEETEQQKASAKVAMQRWHDYKNVFMPYENKYFKEVDKTNSSSHMLQAKNFADNAVNTNYNNAMLNTTRGLASKSINPNSGLFQNELHKLELSKAKSRLDATSQSQLAQQNNFVQGLKSIAQMGQGQAVDAVNGLGSVAENANAYARNSANSAMQHNIGQNETIGLGLGAGVNYYLEGA